MGKLLREGKRTSPDFYRALAMLVTALYGSAKVKRVNHMHARNAAAKLRLGS